jgi:hypothetical protein
MCELAARETHDQQVVEEAENGRVIRLRVKLEPEPPDWPRRAPAALRAWECRVLAV